MALETGNYVGDLVATNPTATDPKSAGDDHLRLLKTALLNAFAGFTGAVMVTGTDGGSANTYTVTPSNALPSYVTRMIVVFAPTVANTGASTINISGLGAKSLKSVAGAALANGDLSVGSIYSAIYDGTDFRLIQVTKNYVDQLAMTAALPAQPGTSTRSFLKSVSGSALWDDVIDQNKGADVASAATIDLDAATGNYVHVTGTTTITAITLTSGAERTVVFDGSLTLTHNATTLILDGANIQTAAGDKATFRGDGSGNVRLISYVRATNKGADIASAATINLDAATGELVHVTGTTTITAVTLASGRRVEVVFDGALTLTHHSTNNNLPGAANITTAAGDRAVYWGDGSTVRCVSYVKASGQVVSGVGDHEIVVHTGNGYGSTNTKIRRFTTTMTSTGTAITYADSAANGGSFTINEAGLYSLHYSDQSTSSNVNAGVSLNSSQLTTAIKSINIADRTMVQTLDTANQPYVVSRVVKLSANDVIRVHTEGANIDGTGNTTLFAIRKVGAV